MKKLYSYDNFEGDRGVIIADSIDEAERIYKEEYPGRQIAENHIEYCNCGGFLKEECVLDEMSKLFNVFPY